MSLWLRITERLLCRANLATASGTHRIRNKKKLERFATSPQELLKKQIVTSARC